MPLAEIDETEVLPLPIIPIDERKKRELAGKLGREMNDRRDEYVFLSFSKGSHA
jgi:hypothetical protein